MSEVKNILLVGVGGQGTILASKILTNGLIEAGYDVKMSEIHGMSQRGGNVSTQVRFGEKVYSPIVGKGEADVIVAFEKMEALRWIDYLKDDGIMLNVRMARAFGHGIGFAAGLIFLNVVFVIIIGFGSAKYKGPNGVPGDGPDRPLG